MARSKTRPCEHYQRGACRYGDACNFIHSDSPGVSTSEAGSPSVPPSSKTANKAATSPKPPSVHVWVPSGTCREFWTSGTCHRGENCRYQHVAPKRPTLDNINARNQPSKPAPPPRQIDEAPAGTENSENRVASIPHGACRAFWDTGSCEQSFRCKYKHVKADDNTRNTIPGNFNPPPGVTLNESNLYQFTGSFTDVFASSTLNPTQAHNRMKTFLWPTYSFRKTDDMYHFVSILNSCNSKSGSWTLQDGQDFLQAIANPEGLGLLRIQDILCYHLVSSADTGNRSSLSFQRGYMPLLAYFASEYVTRTTLRQLVNGLYGLIDVNFEHIAGIITECIQNSMSAKSFSERRNPISGLNVFHVIISILYEYVTRFKKAVTQHQSFVRLVRNVAQWLGTWVTGVCDSPPHFHDPISSLPSQAKSFAIDKLKTALKALMKIVERSEGSISRFQPSLLALGPTALGEEQALVNALRMLYEIEGPGNLRRAGPRHDNDSENIEDIIIVPTNSELMSDLPSFLPGNFPRAPHHLPSDSMERILDIQFRLLREELISPIRSSVACILNDLSQPSRTKTPLTSLLKKHGGLYHSGKGGLRFSVYSDVEFGALECDSRRDLSVELSFDAPSGQAKHQSAAKRTAYWESVGKKRLMQGGLVAFLWKPAVATDAVKVYLAVVTSSLQDMIRSSKASQDRLKIRLSFFESEAELRILRALLEQDTFVDDTKLLIEAPVMFESVRPFLQTLKSREPTSIPFASYLAYPDAGNLKAVIVAPPAYATPQFKLDLSMLFESSTRTPLFLYPLDTTSVEQAREMLKEESKLDPSQADALVDALTSEISLIQGPPGTGKSFTGVELLRVLIANEIGPILLIAFTNHALDNIITHVLQKGISTKIIRLGSQSADPTVAAYSLENVVKRLPRDKSGGQAFQAMKEIEEAMSDLMTKVVSGDVDEVELNAHLSLAHRDHHGALHEPPFWIRYLFEDSMNSEWQQQGNAKVAKPKTLLRYWRDGTDLAFLTPPEPKEDSPEDQKRKKKEALTRNRNRYLIDEDAEEAAAEMSEIQSWREMRLGFFNDLIQVDNIPDVPTGERVLVDLLDDVEVWDMSLIERQRLYGYWANQARELAYDDQTGEFKRLKSRYSEARTKWSEVMDKRKLEVLATTELIGCTTNGAAKLTELLASVAPKVLLVEEAGQVLEAHVISSLVPSIQHMILIGDPRQLRPTLENYELSVDNKRTGDVYRFDRSLMERLSDMGLHMSRLDVQRRMRPRISELIRSTIYPLLQDNDIVHAYPPVRGMAKDVFFLDHRHAEGGGDDDPESASKINPYEVLMIKDLVLYFLRQGNYSKPGDIVVLCAYLGQLSQIRKALSNEVTTVIDERDAVLLVDEEENDPLEDVENGSVAAQVKVSSRVLLRTVDNFQGEEGTIVILSLVRNSGGNPSRGKGIGFLKSPNRANVALSRAREGLYILGNAEDLCAPADCHFWRGVVEELEAHKQIGPAIPVACNRHPEKVVYISEPGQLPLCAPDGGCTIPCDARLPCGHHCPLKCHSDDEHHQHTSCPAKCVRLCARDHPCDKECYIPCGKCNFPVSVELPCGHVNDVRCWQADDPESIRCTTRVSRKLQGCEHVTTMACSTDPSTIPCRSKCNRTMDCCGRTCRKTCDSCKRLNLPLVPNGIIPRLKHVEHPCGKDLYCQHSCQGNCSEDHVCSDERCVAPCRQACLHHACNRECWLPCAPCMEPCLWCCAHQACPVVCGAPCARLPCDERCIEQLDCGHQCPSVCGEPCEMQICPLCASDDVKDQVVDPIKQTKLSQVHPYGEDLDELLITLVCRHVFTVDTLDKICGLEGYYRRHNSRWIDLAPPPLGLQKHPVCPLCQGSIDSFRYGRVVKRADLDLSEQNVANSGYRALWAVADAMAEFVKRGTAAARIRPGFKGLKLPASDTARPDEENEQPQSRSISVTETLPIHANRLGGGNVDAFCQFHGLPKPLAVAWGKAASTLLTVYTAVHMVAMTTSAHRQVYDATLATFYHHYMEGAGFMDEDTFEDTAALQNEALAWAKERCGRSGPPKADIRFRIEACWASFHIRFQLIELARAVSARLGSLPDSKWVVDRWSDFIAYILETIERDASLTIQSADESQSHRQAVRTVVHLMEAQFQRFSHLVAYETDPTILRRLRSEARRGCDAARLRMAERRQVYHDSVDGDLAAINWASDNLTKPGTAIVERWIALGDRLETSLSPLSDEENRAIVKGLSETSTYEAPIDTRGQFYQCPDGHVYVIGERGETASRSRCPECGASSGSADNQPDSSNIEVVDSEALESD